MTLNKFINNLIATQMRLPATILVPTFADKKDEEQLNLQSLTEEDLKLLKKTGMHSCCFCYHIPYSRINCLSHIPAAYHVPYFL